MRNTPFALVVLGFALLAPVCAVAKPVTEAEYQQALKGLPAVMGQSGDAVLPLMAEMGKTMLKADMEKLMAKNPKLTKEDAQTFISTYSDVMVGYLKPQVAKIQARIQPIAMEVYRARLSREELVAVYAFYTSPEGKSMMAKMPLMMQEIGQKLATVMPEVQKEARAQLEADRPKILAEVEKRMKAKGFGGNQ